MIIAITGLTGSGKNTLGELLSKELGYRLICPTFKDLAAKEGISLMEFQERAAKDHNIDKKFDALLKEEAGKGNCVVTTWLGPWIVDADVRIKLMAPAKIRAKRVFGRDEMTNESEALKHVIKRDTDNRKRYLSVYNIDIEDNDNFDMILNSANYGPTELLSISKKLISIKEKLQLNKKNKKE
ncbi:cytidylate kinase family protein [Candidatus Micrarchaeota archaeon]|nr:cytidylate kinase family protein [Candidatus Micrarchaeota archaeon]